MKTYMIVPLADMRGLLITAFLLGMAAAGVVYFVYTSVTLPIAAAFGAGAAIHHAASQWLGRGAV